MGRRSHYDSKITRKPRDDAGPGVTIDRALNKALRKQGEPDYSWRGRSAADARRRLGEKKEGNEYLKEGASGL